MKSDAPLLEVRNLAKHFPIKGGLWNREQARVYAVDGISFTVGAGETLGIVGESGCGKSTVGKTILRLEDPTEGQILLKGNDITHISRKQMLPHRREMQVIFQDPYASLNQRMRAQDIVAEPLGNFDAGSRRARLEKVADLFTRVGLRPDAMHRFPYEFSGGQRQRLGIARALALNPEIIIADEPVSALDVSVQARLLDLLRGLVREMNLSAIIVTHDLAVVRLLADRLMVMKDGHVVEEGLTDQVLDDPQHGYTQLLVSSVLHV